MDASIPHWNKMNINELVKSFPLDMNGLNTIAYFNIIPLGSDDVLIGMDWLDAHHMVLDCHNKSCTCFDDEGQQKIVKGIPRCISIREISSLQLKRYFRKYVNCMQLMCKKEGRVKAHV